MAVNSTDSACILDSSERLLKGLNLILFLSLQVFQGGEVGPIKKGAEDLLLSQVAMFKSSPFISGVYGST